MKLQLLIPTIPKRAHFLSRLLDALELQLVRWPRAGYTIDISGGNIGDKRQRMMEAATGEYIAFIDDDDLVAPDYLDRIMPLLESGPDVVGITTHTTMDGKEWEPSPLFRHSIKYRENVAWSGNDRTPHHLCPLRRDVALKARYIARTFGEDYDYALGLLPHLKTEEWSGDEPIYFYQYVSGKTYESEAAPVPSGCKISACHPTRGRPAKAIETRQKWLDAAKNPQNIEYVFGFSEDDLASVGELSGYRHELSQAGNLDLVGGTTVQNYNAAVRGCTGQIILTTQDDLDPCEGWDELIWDALKDHLDRPAVLQIGDGYRTDDLLITFCVTRPTLAAMNHRGGVVSDEYRGVFCDDEFTHRAKKNGWIVPSDIVFRHEHPAWNAKISMDEIYHIENSSGAFQFGREVFRRRNPDAFDSQA